MDNVFPQRHFEVTIFSEESKLTSATVIRLVETKLDNTVLISETEIEEYDLVKRRRCSLFVKTVFHIIEIFLP